MIFRKFYRLIRNQTLLTISNLNVKRSFSSDCEMGGVYKISLIQMMVGEDKCQNLGRAKQLIEKAKCEGASIVCLPECFNSPYGTQFFDEYSECVPDGQSCQMLREAAKENEVFLIGGSIPEKSDGKLYNTCTVWNPSGEMIAKYRKMHLFDINIPGGITFKESDVLSPGNELGIFKIDNFKVGIGICYDLRFPELTKLYRNEDCKLVVFPGAFNMTTGPLHWELLQRSRANDNHLFVATISPARGCDGYIAWGYSTISDPWGKIVARAGYGEEILITEIDISECEKVRQQIPTFKQQRLDIYETVNKLKEKKC